VFKDKANPIGSIHKINEIENKISHYMQMWDELKKVKSFWKPKIDFSKITNFLLFALDDFINIISIIEIPGKDKKATVLDAIDRLYEYTIKEAMPFWMKPFAGAVKNYIIYILVSNAIDWIVLKYQSSWKLEKKIYSWDKKFVRCKVCGGQ
jgi:hypothetical protein